MGSGDSLREEEALGFQGTACGRRGLGVPKDSLRERLGGSPGQLARGRCSRFQAKNGSLGSWGLLKNFLRFFKNPTFKDIHPSCMVDMTISTIFRN